MTLHRAAETLAEHWDEVVGCLSEEQQRALEGFLRTLLDSEDGYIRAQVGAEMLELFPSVLPAGHPVRRAFADTYAVRSVRGAEGEESAWGDVRRALNRLRTALGDGGGRAVSSQPAADATTDSFD